jgi:sarcosine oxidase subunit alpha
MRRLPPVPGEWIDRSRPLRLRFDGRAFDGFAGDTVTSALLAAGQTVIGRSFKYHRPRSVLGYANTDVNVLVQAGQRLNVRADVEPLVDGLVAEPVNVEFGGLAGDRLAWLDRVSKAFPAGFYYKAFHSKRWFPTFERLIRRTTGLGRLDLATPRLATAKRYDHADVLVVGGGWSGLQAALAAADAGASVLLVDENTRLGGSAFDARTGGPGPAALEALLAQVAAHPRIRTMTSACAMGWYADHWVPVATRDHVVKVRCRALVVAQGAWEQPPVFRHNDRPGVMTAGAALRLAHRHAVACGERVVVLAANAEGYAAALDLQALGIAVSAVVDLRATPGPRSAPLAQAVRDAGVRVVPGHAIHETVAGPDHRVSAVVLAPFPGGAPGERLACDTVLTSTGFAPAASLLYQAGVRMRYDAVVEQFVPATLPDGVFTCGRVAGAYDVEAKTAQARDAGARAAAHALGRAAPAVVAVPPPDEAPSHPWPIVEHPQGKNFVDFDEDLQLKDLRIAVQEGFDNVELLKRFTTNGMGPSQGKHSNMTALRVLAQALGKPIDEVGTTTARPLYHPVPMAHLGGRRFHPHRHTPVDTELDALGAVWMPAGTWRRPAYFALPGLSREACIAAEVAAVRERCGLIDVGTLGKIELRGPQAGELLDRLYTGRFAAMKPGTTRYALALDEAGVVIDDGVVGCLASDHFYVSTTTSAAPTIYREMQRWNAVWRLDATLINLTGHMAALSLAGPHAPAVLQRVLDLPLAELPYLALRRATFRPGLGLDGVEARLLRVGFVGEWGVELHVPAGAGVALWRALVAAGTDHGIAPFGVEAQRVLRLEKGHLIVGQDTDGLSTPYDAGLEWALKMDKPFFVGQRSLRIVQAKPRKQVLVGFTLAAQAPVPDECHLVIHDGEIAGRVTSVALSAALGCTVGLAYVPPALAAPGASITIRLTGPTPASAPTVTATVVALPFYDPEGRRMRETVVASEPEAPAAVLALPAASLAAPSVPGAAPRRWPAIAASATAAVTTLAGARLGFKGPQAATFAATLGPLPGPNRVVDLPGGVQLLRLGFGEFVLDASTAADDDALPALRARIAQAGTGVHEVIHQDAALLLHGSRVRDLLLQACAVDLAAPDALANEVVMTQVIGVAVVATRHRVGDHVAVRLVADRTWLPYLRHELCVIADDLDCDPKGDPA